MKIYKSSDKLFTQSSVLLFSDVLIYPYLLIYKLRLLIYAYYYV